MKAVIFDMDGLMIDSEPLHLKAWNMVLEKYGYHETEEEWDSHVGGTEELTAKRFLKQFNLQLTEREIIDEKIKNLLELLKTIKPKPV